MGSSYSSVGVSEKEVQVKQSTQPVQTLSLESKSSTFLPGPPRKVWGFKWEEGQYESIFGKEQEATELTSYKVKHLRNEVFGRFIDLGPMSTIKYIQDHQWREVFLAGPTLNAAGNQSNDFPGFYYYDPKAKQEWVVIVKGNVNWQVTKCIRQCNRGRLQIGIQSNKPLSKSVSLEIWHQARDVPPTQWDALKTLLDVSFYVLPLPAIKTREPDWVGMASTTLHALESKKLQTKVGKVTGYGSIVEDLEEARIELLPNVSLAYSLLRASYIPSLRTGQKVANRLIKKVIPVFFNKNLKVFVNNYEANSIRSTAASQSQNTILETWYLLSNLEKIIGIVAITHDETLKEYAHVSLQRIIKIAEHLDYIFPMFIDIETGKDYGQLLNPSVLGIYANICANATPVFPEIKDTLLGQAGRALRVLHRLRIHQLHHEPFQLALAASAANAIGHIIKSDKISQWCFDFTLATLLNMYRSNLYAGLFQGCAGLNYPAFKESVETLDALSFLTQDENYQHILSLALRNNLHFFKRNGVIHELPYEGLPTKELPQAKNAGTAIYAAGCVLDLARLQVNTFRHKSIDVLG